MSVSVNIQFSRTRTTIMHWDGKYFSTTNFLSIMSVKTPSKREDFYILNQLAGYFLFPNASLFFFSLPQNNYMEEKDVLVVKSSNS